jgi:cytochrome d ubiquinol oxidase subunit II
MGLATLWYFLLAGMLTVYALLDGFDLGAGAVLPLVAKDERERRLVIRSLGPVWDGNEVWLLAAGGVLVLAFPKVYAGAFSGFYLPLSLLLWLLTGRALSIELHHHVEHSLWRPFWDFGFFVCSALLAFLLGAALGNVARGVDADVEGRFFHALFTDFSAHPPLGVLDWYTLLAGLTSLILLSAHGALWLNLKTAGNVQTRAAKVASALLPLGALLALLLSLATFRLQPAVGAALAAHPWGWLFPVLGLLGAGLGWGALRSQRPLAAFLGSSLFIASLLASAAFGLFPNLLPSAGAGPSLTIYNSASPDYTLASSLWWWVPGMVLALLYFVFLYRSLPRKFQL